MIFVLDTNVISELMRPSIDKNFSNWVIQTKDKVQFITSVSVFEVEKGIQLLPDGKRKISLRDTFENVASKFNALPFDNSCAEFAAQFFAIRQSRSFKPTVEDMMIAGICSTYGAILVTRNVKDFDGLPIEVVNPWG